MNNIKVKYKFDKNYNPKYSNGAYGGINPLGEIILNFYLERMPLPVEQIEEILIKDNKITRIQKSTTPEDLNDIAIRFVDTGVVLNLATAIDIHKFLGDQIELLKSLTIK
jgi:hypothetical protein